MRKKIYLDGMILSASRRTDIPSFYAPWFLNRIKEGFLYTRNPMNYHQVSRISLSPEVVDCIVFWTKDALPMMPYLKELKDYLYYFQYTITGYKKDIEPGVPDKLTVLDNFRRLSDVIGPSQNIFRYDPVLLTGTYTVEYHVECFEKYASLLEGYTKRCVFSFLDLYGKTRRNTRGLGLRPFTQDAKMTLAEAFSTIAGKHHMELCTCSEPEDYSKYHITPARCIDAALIAELKGRGIKATKDRNQRKECGCCQSIDIGMYDTCPHGCKYCYANSTGFISRCASSSPFLSGEKEEGDVIKEREMKSLVEGQALLF
ncbi:MAG: DUF1848 domain-containing protein [Sphaerochaetaceae bacterium]